MIVELVMLAVFLIGMVLIALQGRAVERKREREALNAVFAAQMRALIEPMNALTEMFRLLAVPMRAVSEAIVKFGEALTRSES